MAGESDRVDVIGPDGGTYTVPAHQVEEARAQGYVLDTPEARKDAALEKEYGDSPFKAGALGLARGATLGASDWLLSETGAMSPRALKELKERNQAASLVGEFGSFLLPTGAAGVAGKLGKGAAALIEGGSLAARVGRGAATAAAEGALYGAGSALDESILGETELTAQKLVAGAAKGALLSAPFGAGLKLLGKAERAAAREAAATAEAAEGAGAGTGVTGAAEAAAPAVDSSLEGLKQQATDLAAGIIPGRTPGQKATLGEVLGQVKSDIIEAQGKKTLSQRLEEFALAQGRRALVGKQNSLKAAEALPDASVRRALDEGLLRPFETVGQASERLTAVREAGGDAHAALIKELKARGVKGPDAAEIAKQWMEQGAEFEANNLNPAVPELYATNAKRLLDKVDYGAGGDFETLGRLPLDKAENLKRGLQREAKYGDFKETELNEARRKMASDMREATEFSIDAQTIGHPDESLRKLGAAFEPSKKRLGELIAADDAAYEGAQRAASNRALGLSEYLMMAGAIASGNPLAAAIPVVSYLARTRGTSAVATYAYRLSKAAKSEAYQHLAEAFQQSLVKKLAEKPALFGPFGNIVSELSTKSPREAMAVHAALSEASPEYRSAMEAAGYAHETPQAAQDAMKRAGALATTKGVVAEGDRQVDMAVGRFLGTQGGAPPKRQRDSRPRADRLLDVKKKVERLAELAAQPQALAQHFAPGETLASAAPATGAAATATAARAVQFLHEAAPRNPNQSPLPALQEGWKPSDGELAKWERTLEAVESPYAVLHQLKDGAIHPDSVAALQAVYPQLLEDTRRRLMERLSAYEGPPLSYKQKLALSVFMGQPMGNAGDAGKLRVFQDAHAAAQEAHAQAAAKAKPPGGPSSLATLSQQVEAK